MRIRISEKDAKAIVDSIVVVPKPTFKVGEQEYHTCVRMFDNFSTMVEVLRTPNNVFFFSEDETVSYNIFYSPLVDKNIQWLLTYATIKNDMLNVKNKNELLERLRQCKKLLKMHHDAESKKMLSIYIEEIKKMLSQLNHG